MKNKLLLVFKLNERIIIIFDIIKEKKELTYKIYDDL